MYGKRCFGVTTHALLLLGCAPLFLFFSPTTTLAHEIEHTVVLEQAVVVYLYEDNHVPFAGEHVEVFGPGDKEPFLVESTDADGKVSFVPDRDGEWRLKAYSKDGHGVDLTIDTKKLRRDVSSNGEGDTGVDRRSTLVLGIGIILSIFGAGALLHKKAVG